MGGIKIGVLAIEHSELTRKLANIERQIEELVKKQNGLDYGGGSPQAGGASQKEDYNDIRRRLPEQSTNDRLVRETLRRSPTGQSSPRRLAATAYDLRRRRLAATPYEDLSPAERVIKSFHAAQRQNPHIARLEKLLDEMSSLSYTLSS